MNKSENTYYRRITTVFSVIFLIYNAQIYAQGSFSGDLMLNSNFYEHDSSIGANTTQYLHQLSSTDSWLTLNYAINDFDFTLRYDLFHNSPLFNPKQAYTGQGVGFWSIGKKIGKITARIGYFYDQYGTGIVFRAYQNRGLGIDYAMRGLNLRYDFSETFMIKAFTGQQKNKFSTWDPVVKGINSEKQFRISDKFQWNLGSALTNRTLDDANMNVLVNNIQSQPPTDRFVPKYNVFLYCIYNTIHFGRFNVYGEFAEKTPEAIVNSKGDLTIKPGNVQYGTIAYGGKGFSVDYQFKRTENFPFKTSPNQNLLDGVLLYLPALTKLNTFRLTSRYNAATQELSELAHQANLIYTPKKGKTFSLNYSQIHDLDNLELFNEINGDMEIKVSSKFKFLLGLQLVEYNQQVYEFKVDVPNVQTITPFSEFTFKVNRKHTIRTELQYLKTDQDYGDWIYGLIEYSIAPKFTISVSDMYNSGALKTDKIHYYSFFSSYNLNTTKFSLAYVKQVEGIVCTGGICRLEPAFSGLKFSLITSF